MGKLCDKIEMMKSWYFCYEGRLEVMLNGERWLKMDINNIIKMHKSIVKGRAITKEGH